VCQEHQNQTVKGMLKEIACCLVCRYGYGSTETVSRSMVENVVSSRVIILLRCACMSVDRDAMM
jgi:hypothetical protein